MSYRILVVNPGSTSTKIGVYEDENLLFDKTLRHSAEELEKFDSIPAQKDWRRKLVMKALEDQGFDVKTLSAVSGRGGLLAPIRGGTYAVSDRLVRDCTVGVQGHRADQIRFGAAVFTNLTEDHLDFHQTMDAYCDAKAMLFRRHRSEEQFGNPEEFEKL